MSREAWTVIDGALGEEYNPDVIYSGSQDQHGHSSNLRVTVPKHWAATLADLKNSPDWPEYHSVQAFIRDAIYHRMHHVANMTRKLSPYIERAQAIDRLETRSAQVREVSAQANQLIEDMKVTLDEAIRHGDWNAAGALLEDYEETIERHFQEPHLGRLMYEVSLYERRLSAR